MGKLLRTTNIAIGVTVGSLALLTIPTEANAGTRASTTCTESFARWHVEIPQPQGGYVTLDFGNDGVDYTTTVWNQMPNPIGLGARYNGSTIQVQWHDADGTVLATKGKGVVVVITDCPPPSSTTTIPSTSTSQVDTTPLEASTTVATTVPVSTSTPPPTGPPPTTRVPPCSCPRHRVTTTTTTTGTLPPTGLSRGGNAVVMGMVSLILGLSLLAIVRRNHVAYLKEGE